MQLLYKAEIRGDSLVVRLQQKGSSRILYLDTLQSIAQEIDRPALALLVKIHLAGTRNSSTTSFQQIVVPAAYRSEVLKLMAATGRLSGDLPFLKKKEDLAPLQVFPKLVLKDATGCFANLWMDYGFAEIAFDDFAPTIQGRARLKKEEQAWEKDLLEAGFSKKAVSGSQYYVPSDQVKATLLFLLQLGWKIEDRLGRTVKAQTNFDVDISQKNDRIAVQAKMYFGDEVKAATQKTQMWVELGENSVGLVDRKLEIDGIWQEETLILKKTQIGAVFSYLDQGNWDKQLKELALGLKNNSSIEYAPPGKDFQGKLLEYQQKGVDWLAFLYRFGFSGLLADEMGLGKTVQVLAFLSRLDPSASVLVVAPTSLLFNWQAEIKRFLPHRSNIEVTSYAMLRINQQRYSEFEYEAIILDESNAIKTATTQTARAACKLKGRIKICLSGTPLENRIDELLSQFQFLIPGMIDKSDLKQKIRPFILRRRKEDVQIDLPEKIEQIVWIDMPEEQAELYESYRKGDISTRVQILEKILRLRQICADPRLVGSDIESAKFKKVVFDIREALEEGRKVLVFSQFSSMLKLILQEFPTALYLDGGVEQEKRGELVRSFQDSQGPTLFLLSLKAGGVGLNLTEADYVFLYDPWWNDAVERQAIDRAHRIGRKKTVFVKKYLMANKIEEKMLRIKEQKLQTADELIDSSESAWTEEDLLHLLDYY
jgi:superfamily II DNA or RNA helicase